MGLTERDRTRYNRQMMIAGFDAEAQAKLKNSHVFVAGAGGLGSPILIYLAVAGVGHLSFVDSDTVELSNLNRQILHWETDIGRMKTESAREKLNAINPDIEVTGLTDRITDENVLRLVGEADLIVDAVDNLPTRFILNRAAVELNIPFVHGAIYGLEGRATTIIPRKTACLRCFIHELPPKETPPVIGVTPGLVGMIEATEAVKYITGIGRLLENRLIFYDGEEMDFKEITLVRSAECPVCGDAAGPQ